MGSIKHLTLWGTGPYTRICSCRRTLTAARREARRCEKAGGAKHRIFEAREVGRATR